MRKNIIKIYCAIFVLGITYYIFSQITNIYIPCLYYTTTGLLCPGCGTTRMFLSLIKFDFAAAFSYNPVMFVLLILWVLISLLCFCDKIKFVKNERFLYTMLGISIAALLIFGIIRNIP